MIRAEKPPSTAAESLSQPRPGVGLPRRRAPWLGRLLRLLAAALLLAALVAGVAVAIGIRPAPPPPAPTTEAPAAPKLVARGQIRPIGQARVGTLAGGVVKQLSVEAGDAVGEQQEIARVLGPNGLEVLTAPWRGTVTGVLVRLGDTVTPGTIVATLGDLSGLRIETTDVDEFLIGYIQRGQVVTATVDALDRRELRGYVRSVALQLQTNESGDEHYPVVIDLAGPAPALRPGMTVRVDFAPARLAPGSS